MEPNAEQKPKKVDILSVQDATGFLQESNATNVGGMHKEITNTGKRLYLKDDKKATFYLMWLFIN